MLRSYTLTALALTTITALLSGCAADTAEESVRSTEDAILDEGGRTGASAPRCTVEAFARDAWPTVEPQTEQTATFVADRIAKAKARGKSFTTADFGPYQKMRFTLRVTGPAKEVDAKLSFFHTLPGGVVIPEQIVFSGKLPTGFVQEVTTELYYDAENHGLGPKAPRFGKNTGSIVFSCTSSGGKSTDSQSYAFTRAAM